MSITLRKLRKDWHRKPNCHLLPKVWQRTPNTHRRQYEDPPGKEINFKKKNILVTLFSLEDNVNIHFKLILMHLPKCHLFLPRNWKNQKWNVLGQFVAYAKKRPNRVGSYCKFLAVICHSVWPLFVCTLVMSFLLFKSSKTACKIVRANGTRSWWLATLFGLGLHANFIFQNLFFRNLFFLNFPKQWTKNFQGFIFQFPKEIEKWSFKNSFYI